MLGQILDWFRQVHGVVVLLVGAFHVWLWIQRGMWVPRYIHIMALAAALIGIGVLYIQPQGSPAEAHSPGDYVTFPLLMSGLVYGAFVFFGGAASAPDNESS